MAEPRADMLPDQSQTEPEISEDLQTPEVEVQEEVEAPTPVAKPKGAKTPEPQLYAALQEERKLRKEAQAKLKTLTMASTPDEPDEVFEEPDRLSNLESQLRDMRKDNLISRTQALADNQSEFEEFLGENPEYPLESAAKIFLAERGLLETPVTRKGLQQPTSGPKAIPKSGLSMADVENLRLNFPKRYAKMLMDGQIDPDQVDWT